MNSGSLCIFLGMWLFISGFVQDLYTPLNLSVSGLVAIGISIYGIIYLKRKRALIIGSLGVWLLISGLVFDNTMPINFILLGFIIAVLGFSCICRPNEEWSENGKSAKDQLRNCFKFNKN